MSFAIRTGTARDLDALMAMARRYATATGTACTAEAPALHAGLFGPAPKSQLLIAHDTSPPDVAPGQPAPGHPPAVGFALWHYAFDVASGAAGLYLADLHVDDAWRGQGIALAFFAALARRAITEQCGWLRWSRHVGAVPGVNHYRSLSAIPVAAWTSRRLQGEALRAQAS